MTVLLFKLLGGIGLFLLGMALLTDGLKAFAGESLRRGLVKFTGTPVKAFASGALVTAMVQSSSATTVAIIGFVSAGLVAFPQAIGVVFGASLGTTGTGWIISVLGLKISVGFYALPLVGLGAFMKLLARGRYRALGEAIAGFGLIFIGIESMQDGMRGLSTLFDLAVLPASGITGHLLAMAAGIIMTVLMQSSSAAVATTLTALHTGAINFEQAASLAIGAAVGTTVTGVLAAIGGSVPAKRTACAHVSFNLSTGLIAILILPIFLRLIFWAQDNMGLEPGAMSLSAFHTLFIALGVAIFLPFTKQFAAIIERFIPDSGPAITRHLDSSLRHTPSVALEASHRAIKEIAVGTAALVEKSLAHPLSAQDLDEKQKLWQALHKVEAFFQEIPIVVQDEPMSRARIDQLHALDHLSRLQGGMQPPKRLLEFIDSDSLSTGRELSNEILALIQTCLRETDHARDHLKSLEQKTAALADWRRACRPEILQQTALGKADPQESLELLDIMRWLDRFSYHCWRIAHYLQNSIQEEARS